MLNEISKGKIAKFAKLKSKKFRDEYGLFLVQGHKGVADTIGTFDVEAVIVRQDTDMDFSLVNGMHIYLATESDMKKITTLETVPEVIAVYKIPEDREIMPTLNPTKFYILLDSVQDPGNLGTIIRTAHWFGVTDIYCSKDTADCYNPKVVQSTMGSLGKVRLHYTCLPSLIKQNPEIPVYGLQLEGDNIFDNRDLKPGFIIMGNEGNGLCEEMKKSITRSLTIPPKNQVDHPDSLNVASATAITLALLIN